MTDFQVRIRKTHPAAVILLHEADNSPIDTERVIEDPDELVRKDLRAVLLSHKESGSVGDRCT